MPVATASVRSRSGTVVIEESDGSIVAGTFEFVGSPPYAPVEDENVIEGEGAITAAWAR